MIWLLTFLLAVPLGFVLAKLTSDEKEIYSKRMYFPTVLVLLAILSLVFFKIDMVVSATSAFMFVTVFVWGKM